MAKKIKVISLGAIRLDNDSVGVSLDFDGVKNPDQVVTIFNNICGPGKEVTLGHVAGAIIAVWRANKEK